MGALALSPYMSPQFAVSGAQLSWRPFLWAAVAALAGFFAITLVVYASVFSIANPLTLVRLVIHNLTPAQLQQLQDYTGLGYFGWLGNLLMGNFGVSAYGVSLNSSIPSWTSATLELVLPSLVFGAIVGLFLGVLSTRMHGYFLRLLTLALLAMPAFWVGAMLIRGFPLQLGSLPSCCMASPYPPYWWGSQLGDRLAHLVLPSTTMWLASFAIFSAISGHEARRFRELQLAGALKATLRKLVAVAGPVLALLLSVSMAVETVFAWPGLGYEAVRATMLMDVTTLSGIWATLGLVGLVAIIVSTLAYLFIRPSGEQVKPPKSWRKVWHSAKGKAAAAFVVITLILVLWGALLAPYPAGSFACLYQKCVNLPPFTNAAHPLGTEPSGVDVFSETLHGLANDLGMVALISVVALFLGSLLALVSVRSRVFGFLVRGALYAAIAIQVPLALGWFDRVSVVRIAENLQASETILLIGVLGALLVSIVAKRGSEESGMVEILKKAVPMTFFVGGASMLLLENISFLGFSSPNTASIGLLLQDGFVDIQSWWVGFFPGLFGAFAVFSLFFLSDTFS